MVTRQASPPDWPQRGLGDRVRVVLTGPAVLRPAFWGLRRWAPVLRLGRQVVVSRLDEFRVVRVTLVGDEGRLFPLVESTGCQVISGLLVPGPISRRRAVW